MPLGNQISAPEGYGPLAKDEAYYFLRNHSPSGRIFLVHFQGHGKDKPKATLFVMQRDEFENGIMSGALVREERQYSLPPWLLAWQGIDLSLLDLFRPRAKKSHWTRIEERLVIIEPAVDAIERIYSAHDPIGEIHRFARSCKPGQNESRFRLWLLTYLAFGRNPWVLLPPFQRIGRWDRFAINAKKCGPHSLARGAGYGFRMSEELIEQMFSGYERFSGLGVPMRHVYQQTMRKIFGCATTKSANGFKRFVHPEGKHFPTERQFGYRIHKKYGLDEIQKTLYGAVRHRTRIAASEGSFSEAVANLLERIEADGYYTNEMPKGYVEGTSLPPLCVVRSRDVLSGKVTGIGFSFGKERGTAYRMMLFCMAVPKVFFCWLFGIHITDEDWNGEGLPSLFGVDRGPGAKRNLIEEFEHQFPIKDMAPSWSGQSKAGVESSHPRDIHAEGEPTYIQSNLTPVQLAKKEITRLLKYNDGSDMSARFQPHPDMALLPPSPNSRWNYYENLLRTDAQPMSIDDAVRTFLSPIDVTVDGDGVWLDDMKFDSEALRTSGILKKVARKQLIHIRAYVLDMCLRHIWVEVDGRLLLLDAQMKIRDNEELLDLSLAELEQWTKARAKVLSEFREHQNASACDFDRRFEESTGKPWTAGSRRHGKPKRNRQEEEEAASPILKRRSA